MPRGGRPRTAAGIIDPLIDSVIDTDSRELGYRSTVRTAGLLRRHLAESHHLAVSQRSVSYVLAPAPPVGAPRPVLAASQRGLKRGLFTRERTVILMLDETIITETPPLYCCYCHKGSQASVPITGNRQKRILHGCLNVTSGDALLLITRQWVAETHQAFLRMIRAHWRGWRIVLFEDRGTPHTADESQEVAAGLGIEVRWLPRATPELNAMDHLWRAVKGQPLAGRPTRSIDASADAACHYVLEMSRPERLKKAGVLSGNF